MVKYLMNNKIISCKKSYRFHLVEALNIVIFTRIWNIFAEKSDLFSLDNCITKLFELFLSIFAVS